jgi:hypothetical protein
MTMTKMKPMVIVIAILFGLTLGARSGLCALTDKCTVDFFQNAVGPDVTVDSANVVPADGLLPEHCRVEGVREPEDGFIFKLPSEWNARYLQTGNGGAAGAYIEAMMDPALGSGFAVGSGTGGHISANMLDYTFGYHWWDDPVAMTKVEDYFYGSVHKTNILGREIITAYYGIGPSYAYFNGYSTGGRQALMEAQRYHKDFNGILGGDGPIPWTKRTQGDTWEATQFLGNAHIPIDKLLILAEKVEEKCDGIDGLEDGLIDDPRKCEFNALEDLPACPGDIDGSACFTMAQRQAVYNVYDGVRNSKGKLLFKGVSYGSEAIIADGTSGWTMFVPVTEGGPTIAVGLGSNFVQWIGLPPDKGGPGWDWKTYNVDTDWDIVVDKWAEMSDTYDPNLWRFKMTGHKMIYYHGWADALCWANPAPDYYDMVVKKIGSLGRTQEFFKLYMIPGMAHFAGAGRGVFDSNTFQSVALGALVDWVENGNEPHAFVGTRTAIPGLWDSISRPICPYPEVARYSGTGSMDDAENFMCVPPIEVRIEPETLNLKSKGTFTAFIRVPKGYKIKDWNIGNLECEGAKEVKGMFSANTYIAKFKTQDLVGVTPGDAVTLMVTGTFEVDGQKALIQGNDMIRVIGNAPKKGKR